MENRKLNKLKVALVYDRVNKFGGAERVLLTLHKMFPDAPLYTSVYDYKNAPWASVFPKIYTSFLQNIPFAKKHHEFFAPLMPIAFEQFDFDDYDLVISVTSEAAKGIITKPKTIHVCYCLTPTRYLWSGYNQYFKNSLFRLLVYPLILYLREWDKTASQRPDYFMAISNEIKKRIKRYYGRDSEMVYPPFKNFENTKLQGFEKNYFLYVGRLVKYKRVDLLIKIFNELELPLVIVGDGSEFKKLRCMAKNNIKFLGKISDRELTKVYFNAKAFLMPQLEDFGLTSVEAQSFGVPVIAYKKGGALDTVIDGKTGIFFNEQTPKALISAIQKFDRIRFDKRYLIANSKRFSEKIFIRNFLQFLNRII